MPPFAFHAVRTLLPGSLQLFSRNRFVRNLYPCGDHSWRRRFQSRSCLLGYGVPLNDLFQFCFWHDAIEPFAVNKHHRRPENMAPQPISTVRQYALLVAIGGKARLEFLDI